MQVLAVAGIIAAFVLVCAAIYVVGRALQRRGRALPGVEDGECAQLTRGFQGGLSTRSPAWNTSRT
jgi:hypothetical protein